MTAHRQLVLKRVSQRYGATLALRDLDLSLTSGCVSIIRGPNGSGKSTLLAIAGQWLKPSAGSVAYAGRTLTRRDPWFRRRLGVLAHHAMLYPDLTGRENLEWFAKRYGVANPEQRVESLASRIHIGRYLDRSVRGYSRGQLQRVAMARAIIHEPEVVIFDEPSTGLDTGGVDALLEMVRALKHGNCLVVMVTHITEIEKELADRIIRLERGRVVEDTTCGSVTS